jgi:hypothetical protein
VIEGAGAGVIGDQHRDAGSSEALEEGKQG